VVELELGGGTTLELEQKMGASAMLESLGGGATTQELRRRLYVQLSWLEI